MSRAAANSRFNKKILAMLIEKAKGERSLKVFADDCGISYLQMRKLYLCMQDNPPGKKLISKLASASRNGVEEQDYLFVCTSTASEALPVTKASLSSHEQELLEKYGALGSRQKKTVEDFLDFLASYGSNGK